MAKIVTRPPTLEYEVGWDRIFKRIEKEGQVVNDLSPIDLRNKVNSSWEKLGDDIADNVKNVIKDAINNGA